MKSTSNGAASHAPTSRRAAVLGAGYISSFHIAAIKALGNVELAAVCDLNVNRAQSLAQANGIAASYADLELMLEREKLDVVHVLLPPTAHTAAVKRILDAGVDVLVEKPLSPSSDECRQLEEHAARLGRRLGVSHNFLFAPNYERAFADLRAGRFGRVDQVDIVWNKELGQIKGGPYGGWLFAKPSNVLFEVGPHSLGHAVHLMGDVGELSVCAKDRIELPNGKEFFRLWEVMGFTGNTSVRLRFSFADGFTQHYITIRGSSAVGTIDFEQGTYHCTEHTAQMLDIDRYVAATNEAASRVVQASETLGRFVLSKLGLVKEGAPFQRSITRCVRGFYSALDDRDQLGDERLSAGLAARAVALGERVASLAPAPDATEKPTESTARAGSGNGVEEAPTAHANSSNGASGHAASSEAPTVLVVGGTGFIGRALVRQLRQQGYGVRLLARNPSKVPAELLRLGLDVVAGDLLDEASVERALVGIRDVYHLARGEGERWDDYVRTDVEPSRRFARLCQQHGVRRFYYTSSIAIYYAGKQAGTITEQTPPHPGVLRANIYARAKVEIEKLLLEMHSKEGFGVVIFRPGIVLGDGGNPLHWGVAGWPFSSVPRLWGEGKDPLPIVLVDDCADAMVKAQKVEGIEGQSFNLVGDQCLTAQEYLDELEKAAGVKFHRVPTSSLRYFVEDIGKYLIKTAGRVPERKLPSFANWDGRTCAAYFDASHAKETLKWRPTTDRARIVHEAIEVPAQQFLT